MYKNCTLYRKLAVLLALFISSHHIYAQDGTPDASFDYDGKVMNPWLGDAGRDIIGAPRIFATTDGKLLYVNSFNSQMIVIRYLSNGTLDASFGNGGKVTTHVGGTADMGDAVMQPDGKVVFTKSNFVGRLKQDGTLDSSFGLWGKMEMRISGRRLALQSDGKILIVGSSFVQGEGWAILIERHHPNGAFDTTWDGDGVASFNVSTLQEDAGALAVQPDGKILIGGYTTFRNSTNQLETDAFVARVNSNGTTDMSFGNNGSISYIQAGVNFFPSSIAVQPDGKILLGGNKRTISDHNPTDLIVYRFSSNGNVDGTFGSMGEAKASVLGSDVLRSMVLQADGKILLGGSSFCSGCHYPNSTNNLILARMIPSGALDPSFNGNGKVVIDMPDTDERGGFITGLGNKIVIVGTTYDFRNNSGWVALAKLNNSSTLLSPIPSPVATHTMIPAKIEAEHWTTMSGVQTEPTADAGGGLNVGWIDMGDYIEYNIEVPTGGDYRVDYRVATPNPNGLFGSIRPYGNNYWYEYTHVPQTGSYQTWTTVSQIMTFSPGKQTFRVHSYGGPFNINWIEFVKVPEFVQIPAKIEAEHYTSSGGIQSEVTSDVGGGLNVGWIDYGDVLFYRINVPQSGMYNISFRLSTPNPNANFVFQSGRRPGSRYHLSSTGGWQNWTTVTLPIYMDAGNQTLTIISEGGGGFNINWIEFSLPQMTTKALPGASAGEEQIAKAGIYPNPVQDQFTLALDNAHTGNFKAQVLNSAGMVYKEFNLNKPQGAFQARLSIAGLPAGEYFLRLSGKGWTNTQKIIKR
jgi:uncharacterized delta-60 repeat protein